MIAVLSKPADQIGVNNLQELIDSEVPESDQIEFKERLSTKGDSDDRWITHGDRLGDRARESSYSKKPSHSPTRTAARCFWASFNRGADRPSPPQSHRYHAAQTWRSD